MPPRPSLPAAERAVRSRLLKLLAAAQPLARASLVTMRRVCGKAGCRCAQGEKHVSLYLAARLTRSRSAAWSAWWHAKRAAAGKARPGDDGPLLPLSGQGV
jgi:hypothetical protein